ncbi:MAG: hypothetical protein HZB55_14990 [Deltaproteobacteria bacterium]|nr:hypothetical protein [Deltaproteobacteria bacterium]
MLEDALQEHEERVDALIKAAKKYEAALKAWKKACQTGHMANRQKQASLAAELAPSLAAPTAETADAWAFDVRAYLESDAWRREVQATSAERHSLRVLEEGDTLISSPVVVRAQPARLALQIGKAGWPQVRPKVVAAELKRLRDKVSSANSQELLEGLYAACRRVTRPDVMFAKLRDIYDLFCITPGWKKDNPRAAFGQQLYALHRSGLTATRAGSPFEFEYPSGKAKDRDIFTVIAEDGRAIRYYGVWFR